MHPTVFGRLGVKVWAGSGPALLVALFALCLRLPGLHLLGLHGDEDITTLAVRGIVETGLPRLPSGALYIRAIPHHYLIAPLVATGIDWLPRLVSVLASAVTAFALVRLGPLFVGGPAALVGGLAFAVSVTEIQIARTTRMYALYETLAFFAILALFRFWQSGALAAGLRAAGAVAVSMTAHQLGASLGVLFVPAFVRHRAFRPRLLALVAVVLLGFSGTCHQATERAALFAGGSYVREEPVERAGEEPSGTLRAAIADDPFAFGSERLGGGFLAVAGLAFGIGALLALARTRGSPAGSRAIAAIAAGTILGAAGAHQIGLSLAGLLLLALLRCDVLPGARAPRVLLFLALFVAGIGAAWMIAALASGYAPGDASLAFVRWPGRYVRAFLWPPALAIFALLGILAITRRAIRGEARGGERFLVLALVFLPLARGLLTGRSQPRYVVDTWPLFALVAGWTIVELARHLPARVRSATARRRARVALVVSILAVFAVLPGTGVTSIVRTLGAKPGEPIRTALDGSLVVSDLAGAAAWLRPHLEPGDRVIATDWLTTYVYVGRVDGWIRWRGWAKQSVRLEGTVRDVYLGARVLPTLEALRAYLAEAPAWIVVTGADLDPAAERVDPEVIRWIGEREPAFVAGDATTRVYRSQPPR